MIELMPKLVGEVGNMHFEFPNGTVSKNFYNAKEIDDYLGMYPICNENGDIVEYMNVMGKFHTKENNFSKKLYRYVAFELYSSSIVRTKYYNFWTSALIKLPSVYLIDENVKNFVIEEEKRKIQYMHYFKLFRSFLEEVRFKLYCKKILNQKLNKAENTKKHFTEKEQARVLEL